jgi:hypothetical protein
MSYAIAAYGLVAVTLVGYGLHLWRERQRLRKQVDDSRASF